MDIIVLKMPLCWTYIAPGIVRKLTNHYERTVPRELQDRYSD